MKLTEGTFWKTCLLDLSVKSVKIDKQINTSSGKCVHAASVIRVGVDVVDTNGINAQLDHTRDITFALLRVNERVFRDELVGDSWR